MANFQNPVADTSIEVLRIPIPVLLADLAGNSFTLQGGYLPVSSTKGGNVSPTLADVALVTALSPANTGLPVNLSSIVQKAGGVSTGSVATLAQAFASGNVAGNSIVVVCGCGNGTAMTVADNSGNTYTSAIAAPNSTTFGAQIFFSTGSPNGGIAGGANTVTVTNAGAAASIAVEIYEVTGIIAQVQAQPGQTSIGTGTGTTATTSPIAPGTPNALVFAGVAIGTGVVTVVAAGTGLTYDSGTQQPVTPAGLFQFATFSGFMGNIGGVSPSVTWTTSRAWAMAAAIFRPVVLGVEGTVRIGGYNYTRVTTAATTLVKTGPGVLHAIVVNTPTATATIELDDALTNTTPIIGKQLMPTTAANPFTVVYDVAFTTGLSVTVAIATVDATIVWK
jgi:hypothetical protein